MTLTDSAIQVGSTIEVELRNPAAPGISMAVLACPDNSTSTLSTSDSPLYLGQLRGYTK
jgi:hypothetical protein